MVLHAIVLARRIGALKADRPRPVLVRWRTLRDKHRAFKACSALRANGIDQADFRTPAQSHARRARMAALDQPVAALSAEVEDLQVREDLQPADLPGGEVEGCCKS